LQPFPLIPGVRRQAQELGQQFLVDFLGVEATRHPYNVRALAELAHVLTRMGRIQDGLRIDRQLVRLAPENPIVHYNLACSLALHGSPDAALDALEKAVELGYDDPEHLLSDEDLRGLHGEERFRRILVRIGGEPADLTSP
jgi:hypothetical protein